MSKVLLSKMFVGTYNENSIGHEVINFYLPDNCKDSFLYNPAYGKGQNVDVVVLIGAPQKYAYPVLAVALNVQKIAIQEHENLANKICYGNKLLKDIDFDQSSIFNTKSKISHLTYKVEKGNLKKLPEYVLDGTTKKVSQQVYIIPAFNKKFTKEMQQKRVAELQGKNCRVIVLEKENPQHSCAYCECDSKQNKQLYDFIKEAESYKNYDLPKVDLSKNIANIKSDSFLNFIGKQYSEQAFTNMFYNILEKSNEQYRKSFANFLLKDCELESGKEYIVSNLDYEIAREKITTDTTHKGRLDLLIYNQDYIIIIENKIGSLLNGLYEENGTKFTQLDKYKDYAEKLKCDNESLKNAQILVFLFVPNYSSVKSTNGEFVITYKNLLDYFKKNRLNTFDSNLYEEFLNGLALHSLTREEDINRRFINVLKN